MFIFGILKKYLCLNWVYSNRKIHKKKSLKKSNQYCSIYNTWFLEFIICGPDCSLGTSKTEKNGFWD